MTKTKKKSAAKKKTSVKKSPAKKKAATKKELGGTARRPMSRIFEIHDILRRGRPANASTLADQLGVSAKTIQRDLTFMKQELKLPLNYDASSWKVYYTKAVQEFPMLQATAEDLVALFVAKKALEPLQQSQLKAELEQTFTRLTASLKGQITFGWNELDQAMSVKEPGAALIHDIALFEKIADAVLKSHEISFDYKKLNARKSMRRRLQPYHLARVDGGWYVIGRDVDRDAKRTFALQRISRLAAAKKARFARPRDFDLGEHLAGFGVWENTNRDGSTYKIRIRFTDWAAQIVSERRWHPSQQITVNKKDPTEIEVSLELGNLKEVTHWILSWGGHAKVLAPKSLQKLVYQEARQILKNS